MNEEQKRFWIKVNKTETCWNWTAAKCSGGYGKFESKLAHRVAIEFSGIPLIKGLVADHLCRNRGCVNPSHLRQVPRAVNTIENSNSVSALNKRKTECKHGHAFSKKNTLILPEGRVCRECCRIRAAIRWNKHKDLLNQKRREKYAKRSK